MKYCIASACFAARARAELDSNEAHRLFYAALELRFGIEARMREYLESAPRRSKQRGQWKIAKMGKELDRVFHGDRPARLTFHAPGLPSPLVLIYSPVGRDLRKVASRLGDYLHAIKAEPSDDYLVQFRRFLEEAYAKLLLATSGNLMGPPL